MCTYFEAAVDFFLPRDPVLKKQVNKWGVIDSDMTGNPKPITGRTRVTLRWHKYLEFNKFTDVQKGELRSWQEDNNITGTPCGNSKGPMKKKGNHNKEPNYYNKISFNKSVKKAVVAATKASIYAKAKDDD